MNKTIRIIRQSRRCYHVYLGSVDCWLNGSQLRELKQAIEHATSRKARNSARTERTERGSISCTNHNQKPNTGNNQ
jgi:hypothetical protein